MKNILSTILALSLIVSLFAPVVLADVEYNDIYDTEVKTEKFDAVVNDGELSSDSSPDGTKYNTYKAENTNSAAFKDANPYISYTGASNSDYIWEFDVRFNGENAGFALNNDKNQISWVFLKNVKDGVGTLDLEASKNVTLASGIKVGEWYHFRLYGRYEAGVWKSGACDLYQYDGSQLTDIKIEGKWSYRNSNATPSRVYFYNNISVDNLRIAKMNPNIVTMKCLDAPGAEELTINAGTSMTFQAQTFRDEYATNVTDFTWEFYQDGAKVEPEGLSIINGAFSSTVAAEIGSYMIRATANSQGTPFVEFPLTINEVGDTKFDKLTITNAPEEVVAGGEAVKFTVVAEKDGLPAEISDGDLKWEVYGPDGIMQNKNKYITFTSDGTMVVDAKVIPQDIYVVVSDAEGKIRSPKTDCKLQIKAKPNGDEIKLSEAFESVDTQTTILEGSWDHSNYHLTSGTTNMNGVTASAGEDLIIYADVKFNANGAGFKLRDSGNTKEGGEIAYKDGKIGRIGSDSNFLAFCDANTSDWYRVEIFVRCGGSGQYGKANIYRYNEDGSLEKLTLQPGTLDLRTMYDLTFHHIQVNTDTSIDNLRILKAIPDEIKIEVSADTVFAGNSVSATYNVFRKGSEILNFPQEKIKWEIHDGTAPISQDSGITVSADGTVSVDATVREQTIYLKALLIDNPEVSDTKSIEIKSTEIFSILGMGVSDLSEGAENVKITEIKVQKDFFYNDKVTFVVAVYDKEGKLAKIQFKNMYGDALKMGENKIRVDIDVPENFGGAKVMVWTSL
jgi:hypothetical protein